MSEREKSNPLTALEHETQKRSTLEGLIALSRQGDRESALKVLNIAEGFLSDPERLGNMPEVLREHLAFAFHQIRTERESAEIALGLKKPTKGRRANFWTAVRDADIARAVKHHRQNGASRTAAIAKVAKTYTAFVDQTGKVEVDVDTVRKAYDKHFRKGKK